MADTQTSSTKQSLIERARAWGGKCSISHPAAVHHQQRYTDIQVLIDIENPFTPTLLATTIAAQHMRPFQPFPMIFPPVLLFTSYANLQGFTVDSAGISAAWSGLYLLLAGRRKQPFMKRWGARGIVRGATIGLCFANLVGGGLGYTLGKREEEEDEE